MDCSDGCVNSSTIVSATVYDRFVKTARPDTSCTSTPTQDTVVLTTYITGIPVVSFVALVELVEFEVELVELVELELVMVQFS